MRNLTLFLLPLLLFSCKTLTGNFEVKESIYLKKEQQVHKITEGTYVGTKLKIRKNHFKFVIPGKGTFRFEGTLPQDWNDGTSVLLKSDQTNQDYDLEAKISYKRTQEIPTVQYESCSKSFSVYRWHWRCEDRLVKLPNGNVVTKKYCDWKLEEEYVAVPGERKVEYTTTKTKRQYVVAIYDRNTSSELGEFDSQKFNVYSDRFAYACEVDPADEPSPHAGPKPSHRRPHFLH